MEEEDDIVPMVKKIIDSHIEWMRHYIVAGSSAHNYCVQSSVGTWWNVDLEKHTCYCKKWDISGIPCPCSCFYNTIFKHKKNPVVQVLQPFIYCKTLQSSL